MFKQIKNYLLLVIPIIFLLVHIGLGGTFLINVFGIGSYSDAGLVSDIDVSVTWNHTYGGTERDDCFSVIPTTDGGFLMAGSTLSFDANDYDMWLIKTNSSGIAQWDRQFGGNKSQVANSVIQTTDGGYLVVGYTTDTQTGSKDILLIKTNAYVQQLWNKTIGEKWGHDVANEVIETSDGGFLIVGWTNYFNNASNDVLLIKTNSDGTVQWNKTYGGSSWFDEASSVVQTVDGGFILAGHTSSYGAGSRDMWLIKTDSAGVAQWNKTFGGTGGDTAYSVIQTVDDGFVLAGYFSGVHTIMGIVKTDSNGILQWNKTYSLMNNSDYAYSVAQMSDGGYVVVGFASYYGTRGDDDIWVFKVDTSGSMEWNKPLGGTGKEIGHSVVVLTNDDIIIGGTTDSYGAGSYDMWLVKITLTDIDATTETTGTETIGNVTTGLKDSTENGTTTPGFESFIFFSSVAFICVVLRKGER